MENYPELKTRVFQLTELPDESLYIGSAGFEERSLGFLKKAQQAKRVFSTCMGIQYRPYKKRNLKEEFEKLANSTFKKLEWKTFDRSSPESFDQSIGDILSLSKTFSHVIIDISGMSKMLIVVLLHGLRTLNMSLSIIYTPAAKYFPSKEQYEQEKKKSKASEDFPYFLTTDVYSVVTTSKLSSIAMQNAPLAIVAFPNFNHLEISALLNETNAQTLHLIESVKNIDCNAWRLDAIRWINRSINRYVTPKTYVTDSSDIIGNLEQLDKIYEEWHLSHKIAISPTGGKLQAVATFCIKIMHPDIHILYPVVREFDSEYTEGFCDHLELFFDNFECFVNELNKHRRKGLFEIEELLKNKSAKTI